MSWQTDNLRYAFGIGGLVSFYGIVSVGVFLLGDQYSYDMKYRIVIIALVLLTLPFALIIGLVASRRRKKKEKLEAKAAEAEAKASETPQKAVTPSGTYDELSKNAEEATQFLKSANLVDVLPRYLVAGSPRSGKTSLLLASGLSFQNLPSQRASEQNVVRPTRNCDWRMASEAVLIDTAGRYQTENDADEWSSLVETIKKQRPNRALDGYILSVNAEKILGMNERQIEEQAKILRARLDDVSQRTKVRFPVYLIFTNADAIEGFRESFSTSQREGENLVWGSTIPLEKSANGYSLFDAEFDLLLNSIQRRRLTRLSAPFPPVRQLKIFNFPLHFSTTRKKLGHFVSIMFRPNPFSESPFLRGFYLTAIPQNQQRQSAGANYFSDKLFKNVILRDKDLVSTFQAQKQSPPILAWLTTLAASFLVFALLSLAGISLYFNRQLVNEVEDRAEVVNTIIKANNVKSPLEKDADATRKELDAVDNLRESLVTLDKYERDGAPFYMRLGFYSGSRLCHDRALPIYLNAVQQRFQTPVVKKLESDLRAFADAPTLSSTDKLTPEQEDALGKKYDLLKAYLSLSGDEKYRPFAEATSLSDTLADYWKSESKIPSGSEEVAKQNLNFWAKQVDQFGYTNSKKDYLIEITLEPKLVDDVRKKLKFYPAPFRYYKRVTTEISKKLDAKSVETILAGQESRFVTGTYTVPGAFTVEGYRNYMIEAILKANEELVKDDWVMGESTEKASEKTQNQATNIQMIQDKYFREYVDNWRKFVRGLNVQDYKDTNEAAEALRVFSNNTSPIDTILKEVRRQTELTKKPAATGIWATIMSYFQTQTTTKVGAEADVDKEFTPLFAFLGSPETEGQISKYRGVLKNLVAPLETTSKEFLTAELAKDPPTADKNAKAIKDSESAVKDPINSLTATTPGQEVTEFLKKPVANLLALFGAGIKNQLERTWSDQILSKAQEIESGYPFSSSGEADFTKLTAYLNPVNGTLSQFYDKNLKKNFDEVDGKLKQKDNPELKFDDDFVAYLNNAFRLREAMFGKNASAVFEYEVKLQPINKDTVVELSIDGQKITTEGTSSAKFTFPAKSGETGAFLTIVSTDSTSSSSGSPSTNPTPSPSPSPSGSPSPSPSASATPAKFEQTTPKPTPKTESSAPKDLRYPGKWGIFQLMDTGSPQKINGVYSVTWRVGGKTVKATITPSGGDLFDKSLFRSVKAPQNLLKK